MDMTPNLNLPIPNADAVPPTMISEEFPRLADALIMLDAIIFALQGAVAGKAESDHTQAISTITGLTEALAAKMPANTTFSLDSLTDVQGAADALVNYVLVKKASGQWEPSTALAALGIHNHSISEIVGLTGQLVDILEAIDLLTSGKADKTTSIGVGGLATGGGNLSADRTITVPKSSTLMALAGADDESAMTPKTTREAINNRALIRRSATINLSGTETIVTGIPAEVQRITIDIRQAVGSAATTLNMRIGSSAGLKTTGYEGSVFQSNGGAILNAASSASYIALFGSTTSAVYSGVFTLLRENSGSNLWVLAGTGKYAADGTIVAYNAPSDLGAELDRIAIRSSNAANLSGKVIISWEF